MSAACCACARVATRVLHSSSWCQRRSCYMLCPNRFQHTHHSFVSASSTLVRESNRTRSSDLAGCDSTARACKFVCSPAFFTCGHSIRTRRCASFRPAAHPDHAGHTAFAAGRNERSAPRLSPAHTIQLSCTTLIAVFLTGEWAELKTRKWSASARHPAHAAYAPSSAHLDSNTICTAMRAHAGHGYESHASSATNSTSCPTTKLTRPRRSRCCSLVPVSHAAITPLTRSLTRMRTRCTHR